MQIEPLKKKVIKPPKKNKLKLDQAIFEIKIKGVKKVKKPLPPPPPAPVEDLPP